MTFEEMEELKKQVRQDCISFEDQCKKTIKFIKENNAKTMPKGDKKHVARKK
ncbi:MAG: hypothetical protein IKM43_02600 [Clostridia bacterium]|nr:hypothetical protein [Clostridia bacterium]